jgi:RimJ/RimL family protein N-acetyltransferase
MSILETDRLRLRELYIEDASFILELLNQPSFLRFIGDRGVRTIADAEAYILNGPVKSYERLGFGLWMVEVKSELTSIGMCGLIKRDGLEDVDIGYALLPQYWSKGYATEAAAAVLDYGRNILKLDRILAIVTPDNDRSIHVLEKIGLKFERTMRWPQDGSELKVYASEGNSSV